MMKIMRVALLGILQESIASPAAPGGRFRALAHQLIHLSEGVPEFRPRPPRDHFFVKSDRLFVFLLSSPKLRHVLQGAKIVRMLGNGGLVIFLGFVPTSGAEGQLAQFNETPRDNFGS